MMLKQKIFKLFGPALLVGVIGGAGTVNGKDSLAVGSTEGEPGKSITLPIEIIRENPIVGVQFVLRHSSSHVESGTPLVTSAGSDHGARSADGLEGKRTVVIHSRTNAVLPEDFSLRIPLKLGPSSPLGGPSAWVEDIILTDAEGRSYPVGSQYTLVEEWRQENFSEEERLDETVVADDADADGDGASNLVELSAGTDPRKADATSGTEIEVDESGQMFLTMRFWRSNRAISAVAASAETSSNLAEWTDEGVTESLTGRETNTAQEVVAKIPVEKGSTRYIRVRAVRAGGD